MVKKKCSCHVTVYLYYFGVVRMASGGGLMKTVKSKKCMPSFTFSTAWLGRFWPMGIMFDTPVLDNQVWKFPQKK